MLHILIKILLSLCVSISSAYPSGLITCSVNSSPKVENGKKKSNDMKVCFINHKSNRLYVSESCKYKSCLALKKQKIFLEFSDLSSEFGKPGFKLCKKLGGRPALVDLTISQSKIHTDKCTFKDDSFVSTEYLIERYLKK